MLPTAIGVGAGESLYDSIDCETCVAPSVFDGITVVTRSLESFNANVLFCVYAGNRTPTGTVDSTESKCVQTSQAGTLGTKARTSIIDSGFSLTARNESAMTNRCFEPPIAASRCPRLYSNVERQPALNQETTLRESH